MKYAQAQVHPGAWKLEPNEVWNVPAEGHQVHHELDLGPGFHRPLKSITALVIDLKGRIYGVRKMSDSQECGHQRHGRVSIGGRKIRAFTGSKMFQRPDGSLIDVAVLIASAEQIDGEE